MQLKVYSTLTMFYIFHREIQYVHFLVFHDQIVFDNDLDASIYTDEDKR